MYYYLYNTGGQLLVQWGQGEPLLEKQFKAHNNYFNSRPQADNALITILTLLQEAQRDFYGEPEQLDLFYHCHVLEPVYNDFDYYRLSGHYNPEYLDQFYSIETEIGQFCINKGHFVCKGNHVCKHRQGNCFQVLEHAGIVLERIEGQLLECAFNQAEENQLELFAA